MNSNVQIKVLQIRLKNGAYIDAENGSAYDCSGQMIAHLTPKSLEVLRCIAKHSISPAKGILAAGIATTEILNTVWSKSSNKSGDKNSVAQEVFKIRTCLGSIYPGIPSTRILSAEQGDRRSEFKYIFSSEYCLIVTEAYLPISVTLAELFTALTGDYADFENNGDGFGWISDCFKSVFFKDDADCTSLAKKVLFLTGDCFREKEQQTPNCCESLARLFCYDEADDIITEKYLSFCLSSEKADTEKADHNRMIKAWENFEHALIENVQHSYQASHWKLGGAKRIPFTMADVDMVGNPFAGEAKDNWCNALKMTLAAYIPQKFGEYLKSLKLETNLSRAEQKRGPDILYSYIVAMVLFCLNNATAKSTDKKDFFEKRERYWTALETSVLEKLPPEDSLGAILDEYKKDKENLSKDDLCRLVSIIFSDIIKGYSQSELEPILKNFYDELKSLGQKNVESEIESQRNSLSQTLKK